MEQYQNLPGGKVGTGACGTSEPGRAGTSSS
jgi:hypothetical protein